MVLKQMQAQTVALFVHNAGTSFPQRCTRAYGLSSLVALQAEAVIETARNISGRAHNGKFKLRLCKGKFAVILLTPIHKEKSYAD